MRCSHCGICCEETEMLLSEEDIRLLEKAGYDRDKFTRFDRHGFVQLRNRKGHCVLYDAERHRCKAYRHRPSGCRMYPVIYCQDQGTIVDDLCPMGGTVSKVELKTKGRKVAELLGRIELEANSRT